MISILNQYRVDISYLIKRRHFTSQTSNIPSDCIAYLPVIIVTNIFRCINALLPRVVFSKIDAIFKIVLSYKIITALSAQNQIMESVYRCISAIIFGMKSSTLVIRSADYPLIRRIRKPYLLRKGTVGYYGKQ